MPNKSINLHLDVITALREGACLQKAVEKELRQLPGLATLWRKVYTTEGAVGNSKNIEHEVNKSIAYGNQLM